MKKNSQKIFNIIKDGFPEGSLRPQIRMNFEFFPNGGGGVIFEYSKSLVFCQTSLDQKGEGEE